MLFTKNWFRQRNQTTFSTFLPKQFDGTKPVKMIQIGVYEGMDLVWQMQHVLKHPDSFAVAIDPWLAEEFGVEWTQEICDALQERATHNLSHYGKKVELIHGYSQVILSAAVDAGEFMGVKTGEWDYIIIDGDHNKDMVLVDAVNAYELVRPGGWLVFDDVRNFGWKKDHVIDALDVFLDPDHHGKKVKLVWKHRFCDCYEKL
jgi:hypothetical protein